MDIFKDIIKELSPSLKQMGFTKKGNNFYLESGKNYGVVNFQKSKSSAKDLVVFTINFGVYSNVLGQFLYGYDDSIKPDVSQCQWEARVGAFMQGSPDSWWHVSAVDDFKVIATNVLESIQDIVMPALSKRLSDEGLIQHWVSGGYAGTTETGRFACLTTLLKSKGDFATLSDTIDKFMLKSKGTPNETRAIRHLKELEQFDFAPL